jgi:cytosine/uracil/thiamine/allantoin permease
MCDMTVATVLVIYVVFISSNFLTTVNDFLSLLLIWIGPFAGVWLVDGTLRRWSYDPVDIHGVHTGAAGRYWGWHGVNVKGMASMLVGAVVCVLCVNSPVLQGPISKALSGSDLTWILGPVIAGGLYYVLARDEVRASAAVPEADLERAARLGEGGAIHEGLVPVHHQSANGDAAGPAIKVSDA